MIVAVGADVTASLVVRVATALAIEMYAVDAKVTPQMNWWCASEGVLEHWIERRQR